MPDFSSLSPWANGAVFTVAALVVAAAGTWMTRVAERLAERTGLGQAFFGALFLGGSTSLSGLVTSVTAAADAHPELAVSNALGGVAAQTVFLAVADLTYRKANLEHAAASAANLTQGTLLITLLSVPLVATTTPSVVVWGVHPASLFLVVGYLFGLHLISHAQNDPSWSPQRTRETVTEEDESATDLGRSSLAGDWLRFAALVATVAVAGFVIARSGVTLAASTGLSETVIGGLFTAVSTSVPELVTAVAAVRQGALSLAVGGILGGNCFDLLFLAFADLAYRQGSIYHAVGERQVFIIALTILLTGVLLLGLLRREKHGIANSGFESFLVLALYAGALLLLIAS